MNHVSPKARLGANVQVGPYTVIHDDVEIGDGTVIDGHCIIGYPTALANGKPLTIGKRSRIRSHSTLYQGSTLGDGLNTGHSVLIRENTVAGPGFQVGTQSDVEGDCVLGEQVKLHSYVCVAKGATVGNFVYLFPRVHMNNDPWPPSSLLGRIAIEDMAVVCTGTLIQPGVRIGLGSVVAACSVVAADVPAATVVSGNPATPLCRLDRFANPRYGRFHPWINRFREKYPQECEAQIQQIVQRIDSTLSAARAQAR